MVALPPIEAKLPTSKLLETEALVADNRAKPVILLLLPVMLPPRVKALMVRVPVELERVSVLMAEASRV
jgi:hypothetical protein